MAQSVEERVSAARFLRTRAGHSGNLQNMSKYFILNTKNGEETVVVAFFVPTGRDSSQTKFIEARNMYTFRQKKMNIQRIHSSFMPEDKRTDFLEASRKLNFIFVFISVFTVFYIVNRQPPRLDYHLYFEPLCIVDATRAGQFREGDRFRN